MRFSVFVAVILALAYQSRSGTETPAAPETDIPLQPVALQISRLQNTMEFLGQPRPRQKRQLADAVANDSESVAVSAIQMALDPFVLAVVDINAESWVKVQHGAARSEVVQNGSRFFLVEVNNRAHVTSRLTVISKNSGPVFVPSSGAAQVPVTLTGADVRDRWAEISIYNKPPMEERLSGVELEYAVLEIYSRDSGQIRTQYGPAFL
jgi:hypothetical protein